MILDELNRSARYEALHPLFRRAFAFLRETDVASLPDGRVTLDGDRLYANVQTYLTKEHTEGKFETHRRYIDIQHIVSGKELIGYIPSDEGCKEISPYDVATDCAFCHGTPTLCHVNAGMCMVLFPDEPHMPCLSVDTPESVKKIVVKVLAESM